ncbi:MAG TPA: hypothetical protein VLA52_01000 [Thermohalobaculum sp.]|nr:hypothetical protein [Thermohalobaculum sp.]
MFAKYGLLAAALIVVWFALLRPAMAAGRKRGKPEGPPPPEPADLAPCPKCGVFRLPGGDCDCPGTGISRG